jgi:hypothetical protein
VLHSAGTPVLLPRSAGFQDSRYCRHPLSSLTVSHTRPPALLFLLDPQFSSHSTGPSVRHSSHWPLSYCFAHPDPSSSSRCWTPGFGSSILDPQLAVTRSTHQYCVTSHTRCFGTGVSLRCSLGPRPCWYCSVLPGCPLAVAPTPCSHLLLAGPGHGASLASPTVGRHRYSTAQHTGTPTSKFQSPPGGWGPHGIPSFRSAKRL